MRLTMFLKPCFKTSKCMKVTPISPMICGLFVGIIVSLLYNHCTTPECNDEKLIPKLKPPPSPYVRKLSSNMLETSIESSPQVANVQKLNTNKKKKFVRPRYFSSELGMRKKLFVSVITTKESVGTFGVAINKTLYHLVDKIIFFIDGIGQKIDISIPIVGFKDPKPLIKIFRVLSYVIENHGSNYDYFFFVTDRSYVNGRRLMSMLKNKSVSQKLHMGILSGKLEAQHCLLERGIILSRDILEELQIKLKWCSEVFNTGSMEENLGDCILEAAKIPCSDSNALYTYRSYRVPDHKTVKNYLEIVSQTLVFEKSITVSNVRESSDMSLLHIYFSQLQANKFITNVARIRDISESIKISNLSSRGLEWPSGSEPSYKEINRYHINQWISFNATHIFMPNTFENIKRFTINDEMLIMGLVNATSSYIDSNILGLTYESLEFGNGRYDPTRGMVHKFAVRLRNHTSNKLETKYFESFQGMTLPEYISMPYVTEGSHLTIVLTIQTDEVESAVHFIERLKNDVKIQRLSLVFMLLSQDDVDQTHFQNLKTLASDFNKKYYNRQCRATLQFVHLTKDQKKPSNLALADLATKKIAKEEMVLFINPEARINLDFTNRVRMNTIKGSQVFSPIPFILYHPTVIRDIKLSPKLTISRSMGHFDKFYFDTISFYVDDYLKARRKIAAQFPSINSEKDLLKRVQSADDNRDPRFSPMDPGSVYASVLDLFVRTTKLHVLRAVESNFTLPYTDINCAELEYEYNETFDDSNLNNLYDVYDKNSESVGFKKDIKFDPKKSVCLKRRDVCVKRKYSSLGDSSLLAQMLLDNEDLIES